MVNKPYKKEELEEQFKKLPEVLKDALLSVEGADKLYEIGKKFGLTTEKRGAAAGETGLVIMGLTKPREFVQALASTLIVDADTAKKIASEINHQIFYPLREALRSAHQVEMTEEEIQKSEVLVRHAVVSPPKTQESQPPPASSRVSPIDLRQQKPSAISSAAATAVPPSPAPVPKKPETPKPPAQEIKPAGSPVTPAVPPPPKKSPYGGFDPYREGRESSTRNAAEEKPTPSPFGASKVPPLDLRQSGRDQQQAKPAAPDPLKREEDIFSALRRSPAPEKKPETTAAPKMPGAPEEVEREQRPFTEKGPGHDPYKEPME